MLTRKKRKLVVALADERTGEEIHYPIEIYWSSSKDFITNESIARTAAAQAFVEAKGSRTFIPLGVI